MAGIVSPRSFVELELAYYEPLGIKRPEDRKKLFFLIQRVKSELEKEGSSGSSAGGSSSGYEVDNNGPEIRSSNSHGNDATKPTTAPANNNRNELGMSSIIDTTQSNEMMGPMSPVTLSSPLKNEYEIATGKTNESIQTASSLLLASSKTAKSSAATVAVNEEKMRSRERVEKELEKRRAMKKEAAEANQYSSTTNSQTSQYTDDFDDLDHASSSVASRTSRRRSSMLPRISKKEITTPRTISMRTSLASRPTVKKGNQTAGMVGVGGKLYSRDDDDDDDDGMSINSETSDLSSSIQSYNSSSSLARTTKPSRTSTGTYYSSSSHTNENRKVEGMTSRIGNKRLSTIPSTGVAPLSPLAPLPTLSSNMENHGLGGNSREAKKAVTKRKSIGSTTGRPGTAGSASSYKTSVTHKSATSTASAKTKSSTTLNRPSSRSSIGSMGNGSRVPTTSTATTKKAAKTPATSRAPPKPSTASSRRERSVSPVKSPYARAGSPFRSLGRGISPVRVKTAGSSSRGMSPTRSIKTAGSQSRGMSPTRSIKTAGSQSRGMSPTRSIKTAGSSRSRGMSPKRAQTAVSRDRSVTPSRTTPRSPTGRARSPPPPNARSPTHSGAVFVHGQAEDTSWGTQIAQLRENFAEEHAQLMEGQEAYEEDEDYEMRIRVIVRKRPMSKREAEQMGDVDVIHPMDYTDHGRILVYQPKTKLDLAKEVLHTSFAFDNVFDEESNNMEIYGRAVRNLIPGVFRGKWASGEFALGACAWCMMT